MSDDASQKVHETSRDRGMLLVGFLLGLSVGLAVDALLLWWLS